MTNLLTTGLVIEHILQEVTDVSYLPDGAVRGWKEGGVVALQEHVSWRGKRHRCGIGAHAASNVTLVVL